MARGVSLPRDYATLPTIDEDLLWRDGLFLADETIEGYGTSHVLLSACRSWQDSKEDGGRGRFTKALIEALQGAGTDQLTYDALVDRLPDIQE